MTDKIKQKLLKIKTLAERGATPSERSSAKELLNKLCKKHNINIDDLKTIDNNQPFLVRYKNGVAVNFHDNIQFYDHQHSNGSIVRYFRNGAFEVLQSVRVVRVVTFGGDFGTFGGGFTTV